MFLSVFPSKPVQYLLQCISRQTRTTFNISRGLSSCGIKKNRWDVATVYSGCRFRVFHALELVTFRCGTVRLAHFEGAPPRDPSSLSSLTEAEYEEIADDTLDSLAETFDALAEDGLTSDEYDVQFASGVLTIRLGESLGTYVINKQTPNKQIWFSSPTSGPKRYDFRDGTWIYKHDGKPMHMRLSEEISKALNSSVDFTICSYGKPKS